MKRGNIRPPVLPSSSIPPRSSGNRVSKTKPKNIDNLSWFILVLSLCFISFYAGIWMAWSISPQQKDCNSNNTNPTISSTEPLQCEDICLSAARAGSQGDTLSKKLDLIFEERVDKICPDRNNDKTNIQNDKDINSSKRFAKSLQHWIQGIVQINRQDLFNKFDFGMPSKFSIMMSKVLL